MTPDRKEPGVAFWATVAVVVALMPALLVGYPLSYGPCIAGWFPGLSDSAVATIYGPLFWCIEHSPDRIADPYIKYLERWSDSAVFFRIIREMH